MCCRVGYIAIVWVEMYSVDVEWRVEGGWSVEVYCTELGGKPRRDQIGIRAGSSVAVWLVAPTASTGRVHPLAYYTPMQS